MREPKLRWQQKDRQPRDLSPYHRVQLLPLPSSCLPKATCCKTHYKGSIQCCLVVSYEAWIRAKWHQRFKQSEANQWALSAGSRSVQGRRCSPRSMLVEQPFLRPRMQPSVPERSPLIFQNGCLLNRN